MEEVRSVPLDERTVTWMGEKVLLVMSVSMFHDACSVKTSTGNGYPGRGWDVPYIELLVEPLSMLVPNADSIDSTAPEVTSLIANIGVI